MNNLKFINYCAESNTWLTVKDGKIWVSAPKGTTGLKFREYIKKNKASIIELLLIAQNKNTTAPIPKVLG